MDYIELLQDLKKPATSYSYNELPILKENDFNRFGILIENDAGFVSSMDERNVKIIKEAMEVDFSQPLELFAVLQKFNIPNRNGRIYPERILKREFEKYLKLIKWGKAMSELNHPESSLIDLDRISHFITDIWWEDNVLVGKLKLNLSPGFIKHGIASTKGDQAAILILNGATLGISSRGVGSVVKKGEQNEVQDDFELICFDLVSSPSTPGAYLYDKKGDRLKYEENLEEEKKIKVVNSEFTNRQLDLMKRFDHFLKK